MDRVILRVVSADIPLFLRYLENAGIVLYGVKWIDDLTVILQVRRKDEKSLRTLSNQRGAEVFLVGKRGVVWTLRSFAKRPVLLCTVALIVLAGFYLPTRIFFFKVEGNITVPTRLILEIADQTGIGFGASAKDVRSEKMKNSLLEKIPQLQWAGINTSGCVATISVKERNLQEITEESPSVSSIVAVRDGIIYDMTVTNGSPVCKVGQAVCAGQVLISGYMDCSQSIRATRAAGEIYASTAHKIEALMPSTFVIRGEPQEQIQKISIIFGKKRINFYSGSGILDGSCVKMYEEKYVTLPGGFQLPVAIVIETWIPSCDQNGEINFDENTRILSALTKCYLKDQMVAGTVHSQNEQFSAGEGVFVLTGEYGCIEMIGREQNEEIIKP